MKVVKVYGRIAEFVGARSFKADVASPAEAVRFLLANFPGLEKFLVDGDREGYGYKVRVGGRPVGDADELQIPSERAKTISIVPVLSGAGGGLGQIFAGIGLIAASILLGPVGAIIGGLGAGVIGGTAATIVSGIGFSLALGGVAQMLSPVPKLSTSMPSQRASFAGAQNGDRADPKRLESYSFSGIQNTSAQGLPVPIIYGRVWVGSVTISAGIDVA
jgi:predicted phage tail protein